MADRHPQDRVAADRARPDAGSAAPGDQSSALLASAVAGAVLGAAGLAWWLLSVAEQRRLAARQQRNLALSRLQGGADPNDEPLLRSPASSQSVGEATAHDKALHDKVHELNQAIEAVRRQLEQLQPQG
ncbi:MAG: hypothetical protein ACRC1L_10320 [Prochlorococcaceae cyanobacterium]